MSCAPTCKKFSSFAWRRRASSARGLPKFVGVQQIEIA